VPYKLNLLTYLLIHLKIRVKNLVNAEFTTVKIYFNSGSDLAANLAVFPTTLTSLNIEKTRYSAFSNNPSNCNDYDSIDLKINAAKIKICGSVKYHGV